MARRPLLPPPAVTGPASAPPVGTGNAPPSPAEQAERMAFVDNLVKAGASLEQIVALATKPPMLGPDGTRTGGGLGLTRSQVLLVCTDLRELLRVEAAQEEATRRLAQVARLRNDTLKMRSARVVPYSALVSAEKLIAEIEGNLAPRRLKVEVAPLPDALGAVISGMSAEEVERIIAEERELAKNAASIPTTASPAP